MMASVLDHLVRLIGNALGWVKDLGLQVSHLFVHRPFRVVALSLAIVVMSSVDLYLTILYITHTGMNEVNPLARAMMEYQSPAILAVWKIGTVVISIGILMLIRKQRSAELGAWVGCLVMGWLMIHWVGFIESTQYIDIEMTIAQNRDNPTWIMISTEAQVGDGVMTTVID